MQDFNRSPQMGAANNDQKVGRGYHILIVDDDPENVAVLNLLLTNRGYRTSHALSGEQAQEMLRAERPDLLLLDVMLPGINGLDLCRLLKKNPKTQEIPILFLTAMDRKEQRLEGFRAGAEDYITKPFFKEEVLARVLRTAERAAAVKQMQRLQSSLEESNQQLEQRVVERTQALEEANEKMVIQEKLASMGRLSAGLAHELNNPINFLRTNFTALENYMTDLNQLIGDYRTALTLDAPAPDLKQRIKDREEEICLDVMLDDLNNLFSESKEGFERIAWLINSMRSFAHREAKSLRPIDLNKCILDTMVLAKNEYKYHARIGLDLGELPQALGHEQQLKQVILNLLTNAVQAVSDQPGEGVIHIRTSVTDEKVVLTIQDNGPGVPQDIQDKIFEPFFTTKDVGASTGLGLSLSYEYIVQNHQGSLEVSNAEEGGAVFTMTLPIA